MWYNHIYDGEPMPLIDINELTPGMVTLKPVRNQQGQILIQKDLVITDKNIRVLKTWGIEAVDIIGEEPDANLDLVDMDLIKKEIERKFKLNNPNHPFIINLKTVIIQKIINETLAGGLEWTCLLLKVFLINVLYSKGKHLIKFIEIPITYVVK